VRTPRRPDEGEEREHVHAQRPRLVMWDIDGTLVTGAGRADRLAWAQAFTAVAGKPFAPVPGIEAGRTALDVAAATFAHHGVTPSAAAIDRFFSLAQEIFAGHRRLVSEHGRALPGAADILYLLAHQPQVVQTVVTGNLTRIAIEKLAAFDLTWPLDLQIGGYGTDGAERQLVVRRCLERAERRYGRRYDPADVVVVGDTPHDVRAATANGATAIGVATGASTAPELYGAGAAVVLDSLADQSGVVGLLSATAVRVRQHRSALPPTTTRRPR